MYVIIVLPAATPDTTPPVTDAIELFALLHEPVPAAVKVTVEPSHTLLVPVIAGAAALTPIVLMLRHPVPTAYVMFVDPADAPVTIPVLPTEAIALLALLHVPPLTVLLNVIVVPTHTLIEPVLLVFAGNAALTVTTAVREQPDAFVYDMVAMPVA